ncbi:MAG: indolepyruvate ferredoxin oxidoreductase, partial [Oligoflexales bacterium]|nr:indolepyruvate ferredoxin oxidoreductase [Oligoflexales bacterium]
VLGAEAASHAALDSGARGIFGYPGTPSTEVFEAAAALVKQKNDGRVAVWGANEKAAFEMALGASYAGYRSIVTMKHVGLNVAMDTFTNSAMTGTNGGLVCIVADDPGMHSSQNEQDSRYLAEFALVPCLEPSTTQEVYDYTRRAFEISEQLKLPVLVKLVTRLAHSRGFIKRGESCAWSSRPMPSLTETIDWVLVPSVARKMYEKLRAKQPDTERIAGQFNKSLDGHERICVIASGMGISHYDQIAREEEGLDGRYFRLNVGAYPVKADLLTNMIDRVEKIIVFEENYPYLEDKVRSLARAGRTAIHGRRDGTIPMAGELTPLNMRKALGLSVPETKPGCKMELTPRLPRLCQGCGHIDAFNAMKEAAGRLGNPDLRFYGDIGCYTLGVYPPFGSIHTCVEMGASQGMAIGAALMGKGPSIGIMGDSTFYHSGLPNLVLLSRLNVNAKFVVLDNRAVAMTGQQKSVTLDKVEDIARALGFPNERIHTLTPLKKNHEENVKAFEAILRHDGPDVVVFKRECIQAAIQKLND